MKPSSDPHVLPWAMGGCGCAFVALLILVAIIGGVIYWRKTRKR